MTQFARPMRLAAGVAASLCFVTLSFGKTTIADLAPQNAFVLMGVDNYAEMRASFDKTGLKRVWDDPAVQAWVKKHSAEATEEFDQFLAEIDMKREDIVPPTGMAGMAVWLTPAGAEDVPPVQMLWAADFGDDAEALHTKIVAALEKAEGADNLRFETENLDGGTVITITGFGEEEEAAEPAEEEAAEGEGEDWEDWEDLEVADEPEYETLFYVRAGSHLMLSTSQADAEGALERASGRGENAASGGKDLGKAMTLIGSSHAYAVAVIQPLYEAAAELDKQAAAVAAEDPSNPPPAQIMQTLGALGLTNVRSVAMGVNFDGDKGMAESTFAVHCPEMQGLMSLFTADPLAISAPAFASADAAAFSRFQVQFARLIPVLKDAVQTMPMEVAAQAGYVIPMMEGQVGSILANIGPEVHVVQQYARPFSVDSDHSVYAVAVKDPAALATDMGMRSQQFGLVSREFEGAQIWSFPAEGSMLPLPPEAQDLSIGLGYGHLFFGKTAAVEGALRMSANPGAGTSLGADAQFQKAVATLRSPGLSFSYTNMARTVDFAKWTIENYEKIQNAQFDQMLAQIDDPEFKAMMEENRPTTPEWMKDLPDLSILSRELGDVVGEMHVTPDGLVGTSFLLRP